jgi:hypothetical protein
MSEVVDLREDQPWLRVPKAVLDVLSEPYLSYPGELPVKESGDEILSLTESFLAKVLLNQGRGLGMLYGYRRELERRTAERSFREGIDFALHVLRRFAHAPEDLEEWRLADEQ